MNMENTMDKPTCFHCGCTVSSKAHMKRHLSVCCKNQSNQRRSSSKKYECKCGSSFSRRDNLSRHQKKCSNSTKRSKACLFSKCNKQFFHKVSLINHLSSEHKQSIEPVKSLSFNSEKDFLEWKENEETRTFSYFSKATSMKKTSSNNRNYYYCQHDGPSRGHRKTGDLARKTSRKNKMGQIKTGFLCISKLVEIIHNDGHRKVEYYSTHNHPLSSSDFQHQPIPLSLDNHINSQIVVNVPAIEIYHSVHENVTKRENRADTNVTQRCVTVSKKLIQQRVAKKKKDRRLHTNDITSVCLKVDLLQNEEYNPIIIFKPSGAETVLGDIQIEGPLDKDTFFIGIQTESQMKLMVEGSKKILIVDDTHSISQYLNMRLLNILICDSNNKGWSVAHLISNSMTQTTIAYFFKAIKNRIESHQFSFDINCVITDDDLALINGIECGVGSKIIHILCQWHLNNAFKENIRMKCDRANTDLVFTDLRAIVSSKSEEEFEKLVQAFTLRHNENSSQFVDYLETYYLPRKEKWAMCYRQHLHHGNVNTTAHVESFHNRLKKVYFGRKPNKRIDDLLDILLSIEQDDYATRLGAELASEGITLDKRHQDGLTFDDSCVKEVSAGLWSVSSKSKIHSYHLEKLNEVCVLDHCFTKCSLCKNLCSHLYVCSCPDIHPLCKHIHKVHSLSVRQECHPMYENFVDTEEITLFSIPTPEIPVPSQRAPSLSNIYQKMETDLAKLIEMVKEKKIPEHLASKVSTDINDIVKKCELLVGSHKESEISNIPNPEVIAPNQKLVTQFQQTLNPLKRKKKSKFYDKKTFVMQREAARDNLLSMYNSSNNTNSQDNDFDVQDYCETHDYC